MAASSMDARETLSDEEQLASVTGPCKLCLQRSAKYTCPRCNVRYCGLACYQSEKHAACSESFYQEWVQQELPNISASSGDRERMMEILARCQQSAQEDLDSDDDSEDEETLEERLAGLDLDRDVDEVWDRLTDAERSEFNALLASGQLSALVDVWTPWWTQKVPMVQDSDSGGQLVAGQPPCLADIADISSLTRAKPSSDLRYSVVGVLLSYAFLARLHNGLHQDTPAECAQELLEACPLLSPGPAPTSLALALQTVSHALTSSRQQFGMTPGQLAELLEDVCQLISGGSVDVCLPFLMSALTDLTSLLHLAVLTSKPKESSKGSKKPHKKRTQKTSSTTATSVAEAAPPVEKPGTSCDSITGTNSEDVSQKAVEDDAHTSPSVEHKEEMATSQGLNPSGKSLEKAECEMEVTQDQDDSKPTAESRREKEVVDATTDMDTKSEAVADDLDKTAATPLITHTQESTTVLQSANVSNSSSSSGLPRLDSDSVSQAEGPKTSATEKPNKKVRFADKAKPTSRTRETGDAEQRSWRQRLRQAEKKAEFLLSWTQRYGMALAALLPELHLEAASRKAEAEAMDATKSRFEALWGGKTPKAKAALIQEL